MKRLFLIGLFLLMASTGEAKPSLNDSIFVHVANETLVKVMQGIASDIGELKENFPQLEKWEGAQIFPDRIEYQREGTNSCQILIYSKGQMVVDEYQVGVYLKMKAMGSKAALLKERLLQIVGREFEKIRSLHKPS